MRHVVDARGASVMLPDRVRRVVSLVPSLTEWLVVTGVGERLVGVTDWCVEPADAVAGLDRVRGTKNPDLEAVRRLGPDLVVANAEENRKLDVQRLEAGGLAVFITMPITVAGAVAELRDLAAAVGDHTGRFDAPVGDADQAVPDPGQHQPLGQGGDKADHPPNPVGEDHRPAARVDDVGHGLSRCAGSGSRPPRSGRARRSGRPGG
jgi:hypothetical protein